MKRVMATTAVVLVLVLVLVLAFSGTANATPASVRAARAAACANKIVTVLDAEAEFDVATVDALTATMGYKCLTIGADAETDRDSYLYTDEELLLRMVASVRQAWRVSNSRFWTAYSIYS